MPWCAGHADIPQRGQLTPEVIPCRDRAIPVERRQQAMFLAARTAHEDSGWTLFVTSQRVHDEPGDAIARRSRWTPRSDSPDTACIVTHVHVRRVPSAATRRLLAPPAERRATIPGAGVHRGRSPVPTGRGTGHGRDGACPRHLDRRPRARGAPRGGMIGHARTGAASSAHSLLLTTRPRCGRAPGTGAHATTSSLRLLGRNTPQTTRPAP